MSHSYPRYSEMLDDFESTYDGIRMKTLLSGGYLINAMRF